MKNLVIVESPNKCNTIQNYLGKDYEVVSCVGHFRDLNKGDWKGNKYGFNPETLEIKWDIKKGKKLISMLKEKIAKSKHIYIATDPDREGEAIGWHLKDYFNIPEDKYNRIIFNAVRKETIEKALANPTKLDDGLFNSYLVRRLLDRVIGWDLSEFIQKKLNLKKYVDTTGRVQSVALWFAANREKEINAFNPKEFYTIEGLISIANQEFKIKYPNSKPEKAAINKEVAQGFVDIMPKEAVVSDIKVKKVKSKQLVAFNTASLYRAGYNKLGMAPKRVLSLAQELFEKGYISYHRTDSLRLEKSLQDTISNFIENKYGADYTARYIGNAVKTQQDAHEAITALKLELNPQEFNKKESNASLQKIYKLIYNRTIACFVKPPIYEKTTVTLEAATLKFLVKGSRVVYDGFLKIIGKENDDLILPELKIGDKIPIKIIEAIQNFTKPPARFNPSSLIKKLEIEKVGRPSTYSSMIEAVTTDQKGYAVVEDKAIHVTEKGLEVSNLLENHFSEVVSPGYTSKLESNLDSIAKNDIKYDIWFFDFKNHFGKTLNEAHQNASQKEYKKSGEKCPKCDENLILKPSKKTDKYITCSSQKCDFYKVEWKKHDTKCPNCNIPFLIKANKMGVEFLACENYPECKLTARIDGFVPTKTRETCLEENCGGNIFNQKNKKTGEMFLSCENWFKHKKKKWSKKEK